MISKELRAIIEEDKEYYYGSAIKHLYRILTHNPVYMRGRYVILCRKTGYYAKYGKTLIDKVVYLYYMRKKNILGEKLNIEFGPAEFGRRLKLYHGNIVVNYATVIGDDCELYGSNCIGNKGTSAEDAAPVIGNKVSFGVGSKVIGHVSISDGISISSVSFVNKDLTERNSLYGGVPAKLIDHK